MYSIDSGAVGGFGSDDEITQDSAGIQELAGDLQEQINAFQSQYQDMIKNVKDKVKQSDDGNGGVAWFGLRASNFLNDLEEKTKNFDTAHSNLTSFATNLTDQGEGWANFEKKS